MSNYVITGIGVVSAVGVGREAFWKGLEDGIDPVSQITSFETDKFPVKVAAEIKNFNPADHLGPKGLRNIERGTLFLMAAAKMAIDEAKLEINESNTDKIGITTGTTFSHLWPIVEFDKEVFKEGINFANPALFPSTVLNAASSQVAIRFNVQGFNATISTGYTSGLDALGYGLEALNTRKADIVLAMAVEALTSSLFFGLQKLGYMAGVNGETKSYPFDKRRNGPILGEGAAAFCVEEEKGAKIRNSNILARIKSVASYFDASQMGKIHAQGKGLEKAITMAMDSAGISAKDIDYISSCANSSCDLDKVEAGVLKKIFGADLNNIPVSAIKSMLGESISAAANLQIASCIGVMQRGIIPPTINYKDKDQECDIVISANRQKKDVKLALVTASGPGGYNSACVIEKYRGD